MTIEDKMVYYDKIVESQNNSLTHEPSILHIDIQREIDKAGDLNKMLT